MIMMMMIVVVVVAAVVGRLKLSRAKSDATSAAGDFDLSQLDINLLDSGAAGAFVHGLEDEMVQVRMAAVDSMSQLGIQSRWFAEKAIDFLVDMFNDEIEQVCCTQTNSWHRPIAESLTAALGYRYNSMLLVACSRLVIGSNFAKNSCTLHFLH
jgi:hypothetical protein